MTEIVTRMRRGLAELGYAQRRAFELQTGVPMTGSAEPSRRGRREIADLERAWELGDAPPDPGRPSRTSEWSQMP